MENLISLQNLAYDTGLKQFYFYTPWEDIVGPFSDFEECLEEYLKMCDDLNAQIAQQFGRGTSLRGKKV